MRYRPNLPEALLNVNFNIESKQKIGIVGRTGSGQQLLVLQQSVERLRMNRIKHFSNNSHQQQENRHWEQFSFV